MASDIEVGRVDIPVYADTRPFDRTIQQDLAQRVEKAAQRAGRKMGNELVESLKLQYRVQMADAREALARGLIDRDQFKRQGREAGIAFNRGINDEIERLGKAGQLTQHRFLELAEQLKDTGERGGEQLAEGMETGFRANATRLQRAMQAVLGFVVVREVLRMGRRVIDVLRSTAEDAEALARSYMEMEAAASLFGLSEERLAEMAGRARIEFELTAAVANELTTQSTKLAAAAGEAESAQLLLNRALDLGAAQGLDAEETAHALEQALRGLDEGTDKLLQQNPQNIYRAWAREMGVAAGEMTAMQQKQAIMNAVMEAGARVQGRYQEFLAGSVGEQVRWRTALQGAREEIGRRMIPFTNRLHRAMAGPLASSVRTVTGLLESMLTPAQRLTLQLQELGQAAEEAMPALLTESIEQAEANLRRLETAAAQARAAYVGLGARPGGMAGGGASDIDPAPRDLSAIRVRIAELSAQRARAEGEERDRLTEQIDALRAILDLEVRIGDTRRDIRRDRAALEEAERRLEVIRQIRDVEVEIARVNDRITREGETASLAARFRRLQAEKEALEAQLGRRRDPDAPDAGPEPESEAARRRRERIAEEQVRLRQNLADRLFAITATATEMELRELDRLEEAIREVNDGILPEDAAAELETIRAHIQETAELAATMGGFQDRLAELQSRSPSVQNVGWLGVLREQIQEQLDTMDPLAEGYGELVDLLRQVADAEREAADATRGKNEADSENDQEERIRQIRDQAKALEQSARGALQLAEALGVVDGEASRALQGVVQLASALSEISGTIAAGGSITLGPALAAVGAAASVISAIAGNSAENQRLAQETIESQARLVRALEDLRDAVLADISSVERDRLLETASGLGGAYKRHLEDLTPEELAAIRRIEELTGLSITRTTKSGDEYVNPYDLQVALEALENLDLGAFTEDVQGQIEALEWRLGVLGDAAGTAEERLAAFIAMLEGMKEADAFTDAFNAALAAGGTEGAIAFINDLATRFSQSDQSLFEKGGAFYGLTPEEAQALIEASRGYLEGTSGGVTGGGQNVQRLAVNITEAQGNQMVSLLGTQVHHLAAIHEILRSEGFRPPTGLQPPSPGSLPGTGATVVHLNLGDINVEIDARGAGVTKEKAQEAGRELGDALGKRVKDAWRGAGRHGTPQLSTEA